MSADAQGGDVMGDIKITARIGSENARHASIGVFQNGAKSGTLIVEANYSEMVVERIEGSEVEGLERELIETENDWFELRDKYHATKAEIERLKAKLVAVEVARVELHNSFNYAGAEKMELSKAAKMMTEAQETRDDLMTEPLMTEELSLFKALAEVAGPAKPMAKKLIAEIEWLKKCLSASDAVRGNRSPIHGASVF